MLNFTNHARPRRPGAHAVLALVTLAAMTAALLQPGDAATPVAAATAATTTDHGSVPLGSAEVDSPRRSATAREARTVDDKSERRRARQAPERRERTAVDGSPAEVIDSVEEAQAALDLVGVKEATGQDADGKQADAEARKKKERRERRREKQAKEAEAKAADAKKKAPDAKKKAPDAKKKAPDAKKKAPPPFPEGRSRLFARHDNVHLFTPSADPVRIGFHEAAYPVALGMIPLGRALANDNMGKYHLPPLTPTDQQYMVLSSRGRPHHATSAADIVMRPGEPVRSVVTGMVIEAEPYSLYGRYPDGRIRIRSAEDNGKVVTMLHVTGLRVHVGQQVLAGETIVANTATSFPFLSQIDYYLGGKPHPHVHVEVKRG